MVRVPILSLLTAGAALAMVANAAAVASDILPAANGAGTVPAQKPPPTRLGVAIAESAAQQDAMLLQRARQLELREQLLKAAEARAARALSGAAQAAGAAAPGGTGAAAPPPADQERIQGLARIYQAMKPAKAAAVFEKLELAVQVKIAREMSERSVAMMLNAMDANKGAVLSMALANRAPRLEAAAGGNALPEQGRLPTAG
jgi:flagellar motility protein MotE (MotC chaperone)